MFEFWLPRQDSIITTRSYGDRHEEQSMGGYRHILATAVPPYACADTWLQGTVQEIQVIAAGGSSDKIVVWISAATSCTYNGFMLLAGDPFFKETYALMLTARTTGQSIKYWHVFCDTSGYSRGNQYVLSN